PHVADDERTGAAPRGIVEAVSPRVTQAEAPDLGQRRDRSAADKRIAGRHLVAGWIAVRDVDVDPQHLAEQHRRILGSMFGIVTRPAVAETDIEKPVGTECQVAPVVIRVWLHDVAGSAWSAPAHGEARRRLPNQ